VPLKAQLCFLSQAALVAIEPHREGIVVKRACDESLLELELLELANTYCCYRVA